MKKNTNSKILIFLILSILLSSCKKDFKIIDIHISKLPNNQVVSTKQVNYLIENQILDNNFKSETNHIESNKRRNLSRNKRDLLEIQEDKRKKAFIKEYIKKNKSQENDINILNKEAEVYFEKYSYEIFMEEIKRESEEFQKTKEGEKFARELDEYSEIRTEKEEAEKKEFISNIKSKKVNCIASIINLKNNIDENVEKLIITSIIKFKFSNKNFYYIRSNNLLSQNEILKSGSTLKIELTDIIEFAKGYDEKLFNNHSPKNITISYYISANNRIGYVNNNMMSKIKTSQLGEFKDIRTVNEKMFGEKIYTTDITNLFNK